MGNISKYKYNTYEYMGRKYHELYGACPPLGSGRWVIQIEAIRALTTRQKEKKKKELTFSLSPYLKFVSFKLI